MPNASNRLAGCQAQSSRTAWLDFNSSPLFGARCATLSSSPANCLWMIWHYKSTYSLSAGVAALMVAALMPVIGAQQLGQKLWLRRWWTRVRMVETRKFICDGEGLETTGLAIAKDIQHKDFDKAVISLPRYMDTQIHKRRSDIALQTAKFSP